MTFIFHFFDVYETKPQQKNCLNIVMNVVSFSVCAPNFKAFDTIQNL